MRSNAKRLGVWILSTDNPDDPLWVRLLGLPVKLVACVYLAAIFLGVGLLFTTVLGLT